MALLPREMYTHSNHCQDGQEHQEGATHLGRKVDSANIALSPPGEYLIVESKAWITVDNKSLIKIGSGERNLTEQNTTKELGGQGESFWEVTLQQTLHLLQKGTLDKQGAQGHACCTTTDQKGQCGPGAGKETEDEDGWHVCLTVSQGKMGGGLPTWWCCSPAHVRMVFKPTARNTLGHTQAGAASRSPRTMRSEGVGMVPGSGQWLRPRATPGVRPKAWWAPKGGDSSRGP